MRDRVADVLAQRATLDRGAGTALATSILLHGGLTALAVWFAMHATAPVPARTMVNISLAPITQPAAPAAKPRAKPAPVAEAPKILEPKPKITEPKPSAVQPPTKPPEKNTVPLSPFGRSTKKGSETPAVVPPKPALPAAPAGGTPAPGPEIAVGGTGVTGLEGGDFPYSLYIGAMQRKIGPNWFRPPSAASGTAVVVYFRILRDGRVTDARIETSSGNPTFDRLALSAVQSSNPFNPLPYGYEGTYLGIRLTFK
jgi:protein TonB